MALVKAKCLYCGSIICIDENKDAAICTNCGEAYIVFKAIDLYKKECCCQKCGVEISEGDMFCYNCGAKLEGKVITEQSQEFEIHQSTLMDFQEHIEKKESSEDKTGYNVCNSSPNNTLFEKDIFDMTSDNSVDNETHSNYMSLTESPNMNEVLVNNIKDSKPYILSKALENTPDKNLEIKIEPGATHSVKKKRKIAIAIFGVVIVFLGSLFQIRTHTIQGFWEYVSNNQTIELYLGDNDYKYTLETYSSALSKDISIEVEGTYYMNNNVIAYQGRRSVYEVQAGGSKLLVGSAGSFHGTHAITFKNPNHIIIDGRTYTRMKALQ